MLTTLGYIISYGFLGLLAYVFLTGDLKPFKFLEKIGETIGEAIASLIIFAFVVMVYILPFIFFPFPLAIIIDIFMYLLFRTPSKKVVN